MMGKIYLTQQPPGIIKNGRLMKLAFKLMNEGIAKFYCSGYSQYF